MPYEDGLPVATSAVTTDIITLCQGSTGVPGSGTSRQAPLSLLFLGGGGAFLPLIGGTVTGQVTFSYNGTAVAITHDATIGGAVTVGGALTANGASAFNAAATFAAAAPATFNGTLSAANSVTLSPASHNVVLSPTGTGVVIINPATAGTIDNASIGVTTPRAGRFTTLGATGLISPTSTVGIKGTTTNDNAQAGSIGEYILSNIPIGSSISLTSAGVVNLTSISLTAGDWEVCGNVTTDPAGTTVTSEVAVGISTTTGTLPTPPAANGYAQITPGSTAGFSNSLCTGTCRILLGVTTTVYLVVVSGFSVSTLRAYGFIGARRVR